MSIADKLTTIAENEQKVYDKGVEDGKKSEYDAFWDTYQENGTEPVSYQYAFTGNWDSRSFKPKYDFKPSRNGLSYAFYKCGYGLDDETTRIDLIEVSKKVKILYENDSFQSTFEDSRILTVPTIKITTFRGTVVLQKTFYFASRLHTIEKIILSDHTDGGSTSFNNTFYGASKLENIRFEGAINRDINFSSCPLSVESCKNIIEHLYNFAGTTSELKYKLTLKSTCWTALNEAEAPPTGETWQDYVNSLGWNYA